MRKTIVLVGSSSTGKSTVFELLKNRLPNYQFISESTRTVAKYGFPINEDGVDKTQLAILAFHLKSLLIPGNLVLDRGLLDNLVYTENLDNVDKKTLYYIEDTFKQVAEEYTHVIYFPIEFLSVNDGVRSVNEEWRSAIDERFKFYLDKYYNQRYLTVSGSPMQRVSQIINYITNGTK
jgi:nicotinamide riboside kinase